MFLSFGAGAFTWWLLPVWLFLLLFVVAPVGYVVIENKMARKAIGRW